MALFDNAAFELEENHAFIDRIFHKFGKRVIIQNHISIPPLNNFHTIGSTHIKIVDTFNKREKIIIGSQRDAIIIYGFNLSLLSVADAHNITGNKGKTHGANIVNTQARNDRIIKVIIINKKRS